MIARAICVCSSFIRVDSDYIAHNLGYIESHKELLLSD